MENIFLKNKYTKIYFAIIERALNSNNENNYTEKHHIIPRSLGGTNDLENIVRLIPREHYIVHWLLTKMCSNKKHMQKMKYAMRCMAWDKTGNRKITSWQYEIAKKKISESVKGVPLSEETKKKISVAGKKRFEKIEEREKMKESKLSSEFSKHTEETKKKISIGMKEHYKDENNLNEMKKRIKLVQSTEEFRKKRSDLTKERYKNREDLRELVSIQFKGKPKRKITCPHCLLDVAVNTAKRWHFDNCKSKF